MLNVVFVPLEGVSQTLFWQYRAAMPTLWNMSNRAMSFRRFYTASTSSFQSFCDFAFGDAAELDHNLAYPQKTGCLAGVVENLFRTLQKRGYSVLGVQHGNPCPSFAQSNFFGAWPDECGKFQCHETYDSFHSGTDSFLSRCAGSGTPFALYYSDRAGLLDDDCAEKRDVRRLAARMRKGYSLLDQAVQRLAASLDAFGLFEKTIIVAFGLYGADMWKHGTHMGHNHAVTPYADLAWTPMFLYFNDQNVTIADQLISIVDLKPTIQKILFPQTEQPPPQNFMHGVNVMEFSRYAAFTQNLFALERENFGAAEGLVKSYSVTDGDQRLIVTSDSGVDGEGGMELFYDPRDPGNTRNFLDFFDMDKTGVLAFRSRPHFKHSHFRHSFTQPAIIDIMESYHKMRGQLMDFVQLKERGAMGRSGGRGKRNLFPMDAFLRKRRRR